MVFCTTIALALALLPAPVLAQAIVQPLGLSDADRLAEQVRRLGANPRDVDALLAAAELSIKLDDLSAAGSFLARAEKVYPVSPRGLAVKAALLVRSERPGEALRLFAQAEAMGWPAARFAGDRGLAYDLIGEPRRAQADYRVALRGADSSDEVRRRLALSLGISGKQREALDELAPLIRRNDRAAWRSRAFILAMNGDSAEALKIAQTMMPPGSAQGLQGFFATLPRLPAVDRAFAVHFGEVRPTPQRLADARFAPQLAPLPPEPAPVQVAAAVAQPPTKQKGKRGKQKAGRVALPAAATPVQVASAETLPPPPAYQAPAYQAPLYQPPARAPVVAANSADRPLTPGEQASLAAATLRPSSRTPSRSVAVAPVTSPATPVLSAAERASLAAATTPASRDERPVQLAAASPRATPVAVAATPAPVTVTPAPERTVPTAASVYGPSLPVASVPTSVGTTTSAPASLASDSATTAPTPSGEATGLAAAAPAADAGTATSTAVTAPAAPAVASPAIVAPPPRRVAAVSPARVSRAQADDILAKIVANLSIPASELGVEKPAGTRSSRAAERLAAKKDEAKPKTAADKPTVDAAKKPDAKKALADKKAAAEKKTLADKEVADKKAERAQPARIWVQVAGGANEGDLAKAWKAARAKAPGAFAGRQGYTTPLRATNRVLTGPFKTDAEARAYVNQLAKSGVSAFAFTSEAGQKVSRLDAK